MSPARAWIVGVAGVGAALAVGAYAARALYVAPAARLREKLASERADIALFEGALGDRAATREGLRRLAATTLGDTQERVDAVLRDRLSELAAGAGLGAVQVQTSRPVPATNPAGRVVRGRGEFPAALKRQVDFWIVRGEVSGEGSLEQALRALASLREQPWAHRIESFAIKPIDKERTRFELRAGVATMVMPDLVAEDHAPPAPVALSDAAQVLLEPIAARNVFRQPPDEPRVAQPRPAPPTPPRSPYLDWKLTGVVQVGPAVEAWLQNTRSNERVTLAPGGRVVDAVLLAAAGERAVFEIGGKRYEVFNGQTLEERRPAE